MVEQAVEDGGDSGALARTTAEEGDALRMRAQASVDVAEGALQKILLCNAHAQGVTRTLQIFVVCCMRTCRCYAIFSAKVSSAARGKWESSGLYKLHSCAACRHLACAQSQVPGDITTAAFQVTRRSTPQISQHLSATLSATKLSWCPRTPPAECI